MGMTGKELLESYKKRRQGNSVSSGENSGETSGATTKSSLTGAQLLENYNRKKAGVTTTKDELPSNIDYDIGMEGWQKYLEDINTTTENQVEKEKESFWDKLGRWMGSGGAVDTSIPLSSMPQVIDDMRKYGGASTVPTADWTENQQITFGYLYMSDPEQAYKYAEETNISISQAKEDEKIKEIQDSATSSGWAGFGHTLGAIATAPLGLADFLEDIAMANAGRDIVPDGNISPFEYSQAVTSGIGTHLNEEYGTINENIPIIGGKGWGDVYGLGTSIAQSAVSAYTLGSAGTLISYFGQGAAAGVDEALSRGATEGQAVLYGTALGTFEGVAEMIGIDNLFKIGSSTTVKEAIKNVLRQAGAEGLEEGLTSILGNVADAWVMQDKSNFNIQINELTADGKMSETEAKWKVFWDSLEGIAFDTIAGAFSGATHAGAHTGVQSVVSNHRASKLYGNQSQTLIDEALSMPETSDAHNLAEQYQGRVNNGKNLRGGQINRIINATDTAKLKNSILKRLGELGETSDVTKIADILVRQALGEKLTARDYAVLNESQHGYEVLNEINPDNIKSGALKNTWAEDIGTRFINPEVYNKKAYDRAAQITALREAIEADSITTSSENENATERNFEVSENGNTVYNGADVNVEKIVSVEGGEIKVELDNGETVNAKDVSFGTSAEADIYEMIARMEVSSDTANEILDAFKTTDSKVALEYMTYVPLAYKFGQINYKEGLKYIKLTEDQKGRVFNRGRIDAMTTASVTDASSASSTTPGNSRRTESAKSGIIYENGVTYDESTANDLQKASMAAIEAINAISNLEVHVFESKVENGERVYYLNGKRAVAPNGFFKDGNKIYIDLNAGNNGEGAMLYTMAHEVTHYIRKWNAKGFKELGDFLIEQYGKKGIEVNALIEEQIKKIKARYKREGKTLPSDAKLYDMAYEEMVADAMSDMFADEKAFEILIKLKQKNKSLWKKLGEAIKHLLDKLKAVIGLFSKEKTPVALEAHYVREFAPDIYNKLQDLYLKAFVEADVNYEASSGEATDIDGNEQDHLLSDRSMVEGAGLQFILSENGVDYKVLDKNGNPVKNVTAEMIVDSPLGNLVTMAKNEGFLGKGKEATLAAKKQYEFLAELVNMCINYNGFAPIWETAGTMVFSSMKSNADKQYGLTVDFSTVCKKTQAIVDAMSEAMLRLGRGLTRSEVETIYLEVGKAGESTPCPVCYVFSRWMGIGGILDQISRFQDKYTSMSEKDLQAFIADIKQRIEERAYTPGKNGKLKATFFNAKGEISEGQVIADLKNKASSKAASALKAIANNSNIQLQIQELESLMENQDSKDAKKTAKKIESLKKKLKDVSALEQEMHDANDTLEEYEAYQWLTRTLMIESDGKWIKNSAFKPVPKDILFDLNKGDKFAEGYPLSWAFRTGKGASAGKAIVPYADARVGEAIQAVASQSPKDIKIGMELNPFLNSDTSGRLKILKSAIEKQARQNLVGGQRYQSTSDFRYEYGSDYLITFLEMQAIGAKVQLYTKVIEAVDFLASVGADCNLSVMPLSDGFITLPDGTKKLVYSSVTGINAEAAIMKAHEYNNVQLILVGISDEHIRLALEGMDVTFVIPFHGSGNSVHQIQALMNLLGENLDVTTAQDYTAVQSDHVSPNQTKEQKAMWNLRVKIIKGEASKITAAEQDLLDKNPYLKDLYRRFYIDSKADEYGVGLTTGQAEQIFPYEYWDKSLTYAEADKNGDRFKEYCASMGIIPRFSGMNSKGENVGFGDFTKDKGYWKLLIDRPMYDNTYDSEGNWTGYGKYHEQARINCSNFQVKHLDPEYGSATYGEVMSKENDPKKTNKIVDAALKQFENNELNDVRSGDDTQFSDRNPYSYDRLISKPEMEVKMLPKLSEDEIKKYQKNSILFGKDMRKIAASANNPKNTPTQTYLNCRDLGADVLVTRDSFKHSAVRMDATYIAVCKNIADVLNNSIVVNELSEREITNGGFVLLGLVETEDNYVIVRSIVNKKTWKLEEYQELDAIKKKSIKKEDVGLKPPHYIQKNGFGTSSEISIADFLEFVNSQNLANSVLSSDVIEKLGSVRGFDENVTPNLLYSERGTNTISNRTLLANALESTVKNDIERNKLEQYKKKIALIESEQAKLDANRAEAETLRFKKGRTPDETKRLRELDSEATQLKNRITTYDKQLLSLEATTALKNVLEREKEMVRKRTEQKGKEALKRQKERAAETQRELLTRYQESRHKAVEGRNKTALRHKIKNVVSDLNKLLLNPTKEQHVPIGLQKVVADALDAINMDTMNAEERVAYYNDLIAKSTDPDEIAMLTKKRDFFEYRDANFKDRITALKNAYAEFKESDDPLIRNAHNEAIENLIKNVVDAVGNSSLKDMSLAQLEAVYDMYKAVLATVRNTNKMFKEGRQATVSENSESVKTEVREVGGHKDRINKLMKTLKKFGWNMLKPITAMKAIGSQTFESLFANVRAGEDTWAVDISEAKEYYEANVTKYKYDKWDFKKRYTFKDSAGNDFSLSLEQIMSLYAYSKREQADQHLEVGGFVFDDAIEVVEKNKLGIPVRYEVNDATPYRLRKEDLATVTSTLTPEQKGFVDEMQTYLSEVMGEKGNEVSLAMYDIKLYKEKNYFPLKTSRYFREFDPEKTATPKIRNAGFSKKTVPNAGNPIVLSNFMDVWANHVNDMSMYHAFVLPLEDFMRVYNYSSTAGGYDSVQQYIKNAYGAEANLYIERLMDDLNGGARVDSSTGFINKGLSLFKKSAVFASGSVVVQQPSAIARAFAYINPKYFVKATPSALNLVRHKELWAEVKKYAPVAVIKEMGYFDTGMGRSTVEWLKGNRTLGAKVDDILSKAPAIADELTWTHIWEAVKRETKDTTNLKEGSEEFLKRCGERFTEVITNTQVYDSVLSRSGMMRSKDTGMKMATAFMAEPTTTVNMMVDGIIQGKRGNKKFLAATVGAVSASIILNSILVALVYAARDDDEDETYTEKYVGSLTSELIDGFNPLTYIPFVKDIWSIAQGYDVERSDMSVVSNLWENIEGLFNEDKSGWEKVSDTTGAVSSLFGLPLKNIIRAVKAMFNLTQTVLSDTPTTKAGIGDSVEDAFKNSIPLWGRLSESKTKSDKLYEAILSRDQNQINRIKGQFKSDESIESAMRQGLREHDSRIYEAAQARYCGEISEYTRIAKQIIAEGNFSQDIVVGAINAEITAIKNSESTEDSQSEDKDEATSIYKAQDISIAFDNGDTSLAKTIINDLVKTKISNGATEKEAKSSLRSSMTSYWKPLYKQAYSRGDSSEMARIRQILYSSELYGTANEVVKTAQNWLKD